MEIQTEFRREPYGNFMILSGGRELDRGCFQIRMMEYNEIPGLLKENVQELDGNLLHYYDITSRQPLQTYLEFHAAGKNFLLLLFSSLQKVRENMADYLLPADDLLLEADKIFLDASGKNVWFCFFPAADGDLSTQMKGLGEYLLPRLDYEDAEGVVLGYAFYQKVSCEETFSASQVLREILAEGEIKKKKPAEYDDLTEKIHEGEDEEIPSAGRRENPRKSEFEDFFSAPQEYPEERKNRWTHRVVWLLPFLPVPFIVFFGLMFWKNSVVTAAAALGTFALCLLILSRVNRKISGRRKEISSSDGFSMENLWENGPDEMMENFSEQVFTEKTSGRSRNCQKYQENREDQETPEYQETPKDQKTPEDQEDPEGQEETVFLGDLPAAAEPSVRARLVPMPEGSGEPLLLIRDRCILGKSREADFRVTSPAVSRFHVQLNWEGDAYCARDMNSRNGTFQNGISLEPETSVRLQNGDILRLADREFRYEQ